MEYKSLADNFEELADQLLDATLDLSEAEVDETYRAARPGQDSRERALQLASRAEEVCRREGRALPLQLEAALAQLRQLELPLEHKRTPTLPRVLLIDHDPDRLLSRWKLFEKKKISTVVTTSAADGLARLETEEFRLVIVDYVARTDQDRADLLTLQGFNLELPVINLGVWANLLRSEFKRLNRDLLRVASRLCDKKVPDRLTERRQPKLADAIGGELPLFNAG